jgi:hypothetical protein
VSSWSRRTLLATLLVCALAAPPMVPAASAQSGTSGLRGTVTDAQGAQIPGVTVTLSNTATGVTRTVVSDATGSYQFIAVPPGTYVVRVELQGFRPTVYDGVVLPVDIVARQDVRLEIGSLAEAIEVVAETTVINTTDASLGNTISGTQVRELPLEARNVVGLLSLQPGAVYVPNASAFDPRSGSVSGARADQSSVTLDGVDVNDPQFGTAYSSALRVTLDALQEFRVQTSNYGAETGRSSAAQVSLVTRSGTNDFHGSAYGVHRNTAWSSNEYFLKLAQLASDQPSKAPKLDKTIGGGALGGPVLRDKLFFFGNVESLNETSEASVLRSVPSSTMRDGVLVYQCAEAGACPGGTVRGFSDSHAIPAGFYGLTPAELAAIDPLGIGPSQAASEWFRQYPLPNDAGRDGYNIMGFRFASPTQNDFRTYISRVDVRPSGNRSFFGRLNFQDDARKSTNQFPGQASRFTDEITSRGVAIGWDEVLSPSMVNTFRYGFTEIREDTLGQQTESRASFRFIDDFEPLTATSGRRTPTHNIVNDLSWITGSHTLKVGTNLRFSRIPRYTNAASFHDAVANGSWVSLVGGRYRPGRNTCVTPGCDTVPAVASSFNAVYADSLINLLGILSQTRGNYNYDIDGNILPEGEPVRRRYASDEYELYVQDSWKLGDNLTITGGVRYSVFSPPYETNGLQVAPTLSLGQWFETRGRNAAAGVPDNALPPISVDLAGPANNRKGFYDWDRNNVAPRIAAAWTPTAEGGLFGWLTGRNRLAVRGGYSLVYDRIGQALATQFDAVGAYGLSTSLSTPFGAYNENEPSVRFVRINAIPATRVSAPPGGFPQTPASGAGEITSTLDDTITTPYSHVFNVVVGRELAGNFSVEAAYVGRRGRNLLVRRDLAMPLNLVDPASGMDYYTAARVLIDAMRVSPNGRIAPIPYWENLFPDAAGGGLTATQAMGESYMDAENDWITALWLADQFCFPACSRFGEFAYFNQQYDSLAAQSSIGRGEYDALQLSLRKRFTRGYQFDLNYTYSRSKDHGSAVERGSTFTTFSNGGYTGFLVDSWNPDKQYSYSDFDVRHQFNANWVAELPFGRGRPIGRNANGLLNTLIGNWTLAGLLRVTSGFPFSIFNCRSCWATNWNLQGNAELVTPGVRPPTGTTRNAVGNNPSPFTNVSEVGTYIRRLYPGEVGIRNLLRGDGYFSIDASLGKGFTMPWAGHRLRFRWDVFNVTNTPSFNTGALDMFPDIASTFGRYNGTLATCDGGAGRCMQFALRYEF